jgi:hypothetical protein
VHHAQVVEENHVTAAQREPLLHLLAGDVHSVDGLDLFGAKRGEVLWPGAGWGAVEARAGTLDREAAGGKGEEKGAIVGAVEDLWTAPALGESFG